MVESVFKHGSFLWFGYKLGLQMGSDKVEKKWFMQTGGGVQGPFTMAQLQMQVERGLLKKTSTIREEEGDNWINAAQVPLIFAPWIQVERKDEVALRPVAVGNYTVPLPPNQSRNALPITYFAGAGLALVTMGLLALILLLAAIGERADNDYVATAEAGSNPTQAVAEIASDIHPNSATTTQPVIDDRSEAAIAPVPSVDTNPRTVDSPVKEMSTEELVAKTSRSVGIVSSSKGSGSCFLVGAGIVATNYHVIADCFIGTDRIELHFPDGLAGERGPHTAEFVTELPDRDLAILRVKTAIPALPIDGTHKFRRSQDIVTIGSPGLFEGKSILPNALTRGVLSAEITIHGLHHYQISNVLNPGNSGGPVLGMDGAVIGVAVSGSRSEQGVNFCVPATYLADLIAESSKDGCAVSPREIAQHNARCIVRELTESTLALTGEVIRMSDYMVSEFGGTGIPMHTFMTVLKGGLEKNAPSLLKDFTLELRELSEDDQLTANQRAEVAELLRRHRSIHAAMDNPPTSLSRLSTTIDELNYQFMVQLQKLDQALELGQPHLFHE